MMPKEDLKSIAEFIKSVDPAIPWHVTQFYPTYKLTGAPRTPIKTLRWERQMGFDTGLKYVYEGNVPGEGGENTYCPNCRELLIQRFGFSIQESRIKRREVFKLRCGNRGGYGSNSISLNFFRCSVKLF